jgi:hypothetical protein
VKEWLEQAGARMRRVMYDRASQFTRATKEGDADYILFGQCVIEPRLNTQRTGMLYRTWHLRDCVWAENADLAIDKFHRKWKLDARALCKLYPDTLAPEVKTKAAKDPFTEINCASSCCRRMNMTVTAGTKTRPPPPIVVRTRSSKS